MQTIAPAATRHQTSRVLVNDHHLVVLHDIFHVELVKRIGFQQLRNRVNLLRLQLKVGLQFRLCFQAFACVGFRAGVNVVQHRRQIRQHKRVGILRADVVAAFFREVSFVTFFVHRKKQFFLLTIQIHFLLILMQRQFRAVHHAGVFGQLQKFHQTFGARLAGLDAKK